MNAAPGVPPQHAGQIEVFAQGTTCEKNNATHQFAIGPAASRAIRDWVLKGRPPSPSPFLLPSRDNAYGHMTTDAVSKLFHRLLARQAALG